MKVDTAKIRSNLGSRDSIGLKREDVLQLLDGYELAAGQPTNADELHRFAVEHND